MVIVNDERYHYQWSVDNLVEIEKGWILKGGRVYDPEPRVLDSAGQPVSRLYVAGEITAIFGHLYLEAGNITECFVSGKIAGTNAAKENPWN